MLTAQSHLAANLAALGERNADLAQKLTAVPPRDGLTFADSSEGALCATLDGRQLCSRHRPMEEAERLVRDIDLVEHAVVVCLGFGLGHHVRKLAERAQRATLIIVFEPDLGLLRSALDEIDHSSWLRDALVLLIIDPADRAALGAKLQGAESILAQGVAFLEHPPSRARLGQAAAEFTTTFGEHIAAAKTTLTTTLMRSVDTVRNLMLNVDHYAAGPGIAELKDAARGCAAVIVSAGPSLHKNMHELARPGVRDRCVIIAVQTALKPLLAAGIQPHFVTALDYHEISRRFYEDLDAFDFSRTTLVAEPKAHPVILDMFPGQVRCCGNGFLDKLLGSEPSAGGSLARDMGTLPAGATVAHLALYLARHLGCDPIAMIGQDLGFPDGLYYAPGTSIHDVWAPELNPFNTIEMMEWQRIVRHRLHLHKVKDVHGKAIYTDAQMHTYLQQFERDFREYSRQGMTIIDATEGGVAKQHTQALPLREFLNRHATRPAPSWPPHQGRGTLDAQRLAATRQRVATVRGDVLRVRDISRQTASLIETMLEEQSNPARMAEHFKKIDRHRKEIETRFEAFELINHLNQLGVFKRLKADRRLHMQRDHDPMARQRGQLQRDLENVQWTADAAQELLDQLATSETLLAGRTVSQARGLSRKAAAATQTPATVIPVMVPIDPRRNGLGLARDLGERLGRETVLQATLRRLGESTTLDRIILIVPEGDSIDDLIDPSKIGLPIEIERCIGSPFGPEQPAIAAARLWARTCWRGGIAGMSVYDEVLCPQVMNDVMQRRNIPAALIAGPDWPLINVVSEGGCDDVVRRHLANPAQNSLVFTQSPPGLCGCVISASLMMELSLRNRLSTVGALLTYQPHAPQHDPIAREPNVQIDHRVRRSLIRATLDSPRQHDVLRTALAAGDLHEVIAAVEQAEAADPAIEHVVVELCTDRLSHGLFARRLGVFTPRPRMTIEQARAVLDQLAKLPGVVITLGGGGDPLLQPQLAEIIRMARSLGIAGIHVRTELLCDRAAIDALLACEVDIVSVDLNADRAATYQAMMGLDGFKNVLMNLEYLLERRRKLTAHPGTAAFALPWVVPHMQRCVETYEDIESFFDRWQHTLGTAVIADPPHSDADPPGLTPAITPPRVVQRDRLRTITILSDGTVPHDWLDLTGGSVAGNALQRPIDELWRSIVAHWRSQQ